MLISNLRESKGYRARRLVREFSDKNWKRRGIKICPERCTKLVYLIFLQEVADHAHRAAVWCSVEQSLIDCTVDLWPAHLRACV